MTCQECKQKEATVHFTKIINGEKSEMHLCESCAKDKGEWISSGTSPFSINHLLSGLLNFDATKSQTVQGPIRCPSCGLTLSQFNQVGRFGCSDCYQAFQDRLDPLLRRIQGSSIHSGKVPTRAGGSIRLKKELIELKRQLTQAVQAEHFEKAATLRDQIRSLEEDLGK